MQKALVSVMGVDQPGIIARVSTALFEQNINILEITQTILDHYFMMMMIVDTSAAKGNFVEVSQLLSKTGESCGVVIQMQRTDLFDAMHRI